MGIFWEFLKNPKRTGAVATSSRRLARMICSEIGVEDASVIVEYGPGTGVFTEEILRVKKPEANFFAIEHSPTLADSFRRKFPDVRLFEDSAENVADMLDETGHGQIDSIVCGLPWAAFDEDLQDSLLNATLASLKPGGQFATFAYLQGLLLPAGKRFKKKLAESFSKVERSPTIWRNIPPAFVYRCTK
ncbi:MAG: methyltransferase domain-containing protein [Phycisphaerae bacterium]|jgi:phospholipid N-methyltransferase|nr:methyltransferase domain-containing protein [Phycisphaerae bacterium]